MTKRREELNDDQVKVLVNEILGTGDLRVQNAFLILIDSIVFKSGDDQALAARKRAACFADYKPSVMTDEIARIRKAFLTTGSVPKGGEV